MASKNFTSGDVSNALRKIADPDIAEHSQRFFKSGKGEYAEGDRFLGIRVPQQRKIARKFRDLSLPEVEKLLSSPFHEERLAALFILVYQFDKGDETVKKNIFDLYIKNRRYVNNWDLVDSSARQIAGRYLEDKNRDLLYRFAQSESLWDRRISIIATHHYINSGDLDDTFKIADILLNDPHDLIHKATGWMLREAGLQNHDELVLFLKERYMNMPRTMLRYAIEKFPEKKRKAFLEGRV